MKWIDYTTPHSVREAVDLLNDAGDGARMMAGGTDLIVQLRASAYDLDLVVDAKGIPELNVRMRLSLVYLQTIPKRMT